MMSCTHKPHRRIQIFDLVRPPERGGLKPPEIIHCMRKGSIAEPFLISNPLDMTALAVPDHTEKDITD